MRKFMFLAGVALAASLPAAAAADREGGRGQGRGPSAQAEQKGGGAARAERGRGAERAERRGGGRDLAARQPRGNAQAERRLSREQRRVERAITQERRASADARRQRQAERGPDARLARQAERRERDLERWTDRRLVVGDRFRDDFLRFREARGRRLAIGPAGCPPGLARQNAWCLPPGQLRRAALIGRRVPFAAWPYNVPDRYRYRFADTGDYLYRYVNDGTIYRIDRDTGLVSSVIPLYSSGLFPGEPLPLGYDVYNVPLAYRDYYPDGDDYLYRYDGSAIYRVDSGSGLVDGIVALLTGGGGGLGGLGVGDRLPPGYGVYNVPLDYRDRYVDGDDAFYRYADGSIYQVDPQTQMIESVISLLV